MLTSVSVSLVWLIPGLDPAAAATPLWSILPALALALAGTVAFKAWEIRATAALLLLHRQRQQQQQIQGGGADEALYPPGLAPVADAMHSYGAAAHCPPSASLELLHAATVPLIIPGITGSSSDHVDEDGM